MIKDPNSSIKKLTKRFGWRVHQNGFCLSCLHWDRNQLLCYLKLFDPFRNFCYRDVPNSTWNSYAIETSNENALGCTRHFLSGVWEATEIWKYCVWFNEWQMKLCRFCYLVLLLHAYLKYLMSYVTLLLVCWSLLIMSKGKLACGLPTFSFYLSFIIFSPF